VLTGAAARFLTFTISQVKEWPFSIPNYNSGRRSFNHNPAPLRAAGFTKGRYYAEIIADRFCWHTVFVTFFYTRVHSSLSSFCRDRYRTVRTTVALTALPCATSRLDAGLDPTCRHLLTAAALPLGSPSSPFQNAVEKSLKQAAQSP
jgi:hypothetical protein